MKSAVRLFVVVLIAAWSTAIQGAASMRFDVDDGPTIVANDLVPNPAQPYRLERAFIKSWSTSGDADDRPTADEFSFTSLSGQSPTLTPGGDWTFDSFFDITYRIELSIDGGPFVEHAGLGTAHVIGMAPSGPGPRVFQTEMLALNISGTHDPTTTFMIRESPTLASAGRTTIESLPGGQYRIDSFFDIFTELSLDGGQTWAPAVPEPGTVLLSALGACTLVAARRGMRDGAGQRPSRQLAGFRLTRSQR